MTKKKLYFFVGAIHLAGYIWLISNILFRANMEMGCLFHKITGVPCPACGSTRSVLFLLKGDFANALYSNPFGYIILVCMIGLPCWLFVDFIGEKDSFIRFYQKAESVLKKKQVAILAVVLVLTNWIWNVYKYF